MSQEKVVHDVTYAGDLYRLVISPDGSYVIKQFERGLSRAFELDMDEVPSPVQNILKEILQ